MTTEEIRRQALSLPLHQRAHLAEQLLSSLDELSEAESARLWLDEAERRAAEIDRGAVELVSAEELERQVEQIFKRAIGCTRRRLPSTADRWPITRIFALGSDGVITPRSARRY